MNCKCQCKLVWEERYLMRKIIRTFKNVEGFIYKENTCDPDELLRMLKEIQKYAEEE